MVTAVAVDIVRRGRRRRTRRRMITTAVLAAVVLVLFSASLMFGHTTYGPGVVLRTILGEDVAGASFTVGQLRLPRAVLAVLVGGCFGMAGTTFQTLLRNQLAAPDIMGITSGASAAAVYAIIMLGWDESAVSGLAIVASLATASVIYLLSARDGFSGTRLILIGIAVSAMLESVVAYVIVRAAEWDLQVAMRWLTGSLNSTTWDQVVPVALAFALLAPVLLLHGRRLDLLHHGADAATALGVRAGRTQVVVVLTAVALIAFATAASGPVAFVAFLAGPIAFRLVGAGGSLLLPAALVGAVLVLAADFAGQWFFGTRYPVGVVTGALGAPYLVLLMIRVNRAGGSL